MTEMMLRMMTMTMMTTTITVVIHQCRWCFEARMVFRLHAVLHIFQHILHGKDVISADLVNTDLATIALPDMGVQLGGRCWGIHSCNPLACAWHTCNR